MISPLSLLCVWGGRLLSKVDNIPVFPLATCLRPRGLCHIFLEIQLSASKPVGGGKTQLQTCSSGAITPVYMWCELSSSQEFTVHSSSFLPFLSLGKSNTSFPSKQWKNIKGNEASKLICSQYVLLSSSLPPWSSVPDISMKDLCLQVYCTFDSDLRNQVTPVRGLLWEEKNST